MTTPLRPLSTGELLDTTFSLYRSHFLLFVGLIAVPYLIILPFQILGVVIQPTGFTFSLTSVVLALVIALAVLVASAASQGATLIAVSHVYLGRPVTVTGALLRIRGRVLGLSVLIFVMGIGVVMGLVLLIVPGVIFALMWSLAVPVAVLEDEPIFVSLSRSVALTQGFRLRILLVYVLFILITWIVSILLSVPVGVIVFMSMLQHGPGTVMPGWVQVFNIASSFVTHCLVGPLMTIAFAVLYYDVRVRKEAFDLQLMMTALDGPGAQAPDTQAGA
jgi:hypothetical protein